MHFFMTDCINTSMLTSVSGTVTSTDSVDFQIHNQTCFKQLVKGHEQIIFEGRSLLTTSQFTIKMNDWEHKILTFEGRQLVNRSDH